MYNSQRYTHTHAHTHTHTHGHTHTHTHQLTQIRVQTMGQTVLLFVYLLHRYIKRVNNHYYHRNQFSQQICYPGKRASALKYRPNYVAFLRFATRLGNSGKTIYFKHDSKYFLKLQHRRSVCLDCSFLYSLFTRCRWLQELVAAVICPRHN